MSSEQRRAYDKQCKGKRPYKRRRDARRAKRRIETNTNGEKYDVYHCPWCDFFHVGHKLIPSKGGRDADALDATGTAMAGDQ